MSLYCLEKYEPHGKLGIRRDQPNHRIEMKFCVGGGDLQEIVLRFEFYQNRSSGFGAAWGARNLRFLIDLTALRPLSVQMLLHCRHTTEKYCNERVSYA